MRGSHYWNWCRHVLKCEIVGSRSVEIASGVALQLLQLEALPRLGAPQDWNLKKDEALGRSIRFSACFSDDEEVQGIVHLQWRLMNFKMYLQLQLHQLQQLHQLRQLQQHLDSQILRAMWSSWLLDSNGHHCRYHQVSWNLTDVGS